MGDLGGWYPLGPDFAPSSAAAAVAARLARREGRGVPGPQVDRQHVAVPVQDVEGVRGLLLAAAEARDGAGLDLQDPEAGVLADAAAPGEMQVAGEEDLGVGERG